MRNAAVPDHRPRVSLLRALVAVVSIAAAASVIGQQAARQPIPEIDDPLLNARYHALIQEVRCLVCENRSIAESPSDIATDLKGLIREMLVAGKSDSEITEFLAARYGDSILSDAAIQDGRISKRMMGHVIADAMSELGISRFAVAGHDRGARVAYRLALDHAARVRAVAILDVIPILDMAERLTYQAARQMGHWLWLTQPSTVPETLIGCDPGLYVRHIIEQWDGGKTAPGPRRPSGAAGTRGPAGRSPEVGTRTRCRVRCRTSAAAVRLRP